MKYRVVAAVGAMVIMGCIVLSCVNPIAPKTEPNINVPYYEDIVIVEPERVIVRAEIQRSKPDPQGERSGMLCDVYDEVEHEQETSEEVCTETIGEELGMDGCSESETYADTAEAIGYSSCPTTMETAPATQEAQAVLQATPEPIPEVNTDPHDILLNALREANIEFWYPYACAQIQQESHWNPWAENPNGLDKGLLQFRILYWSEPESIFDVNAQIRKYVGQVAARIAAGLSVEEIISRHFTSDYCPGVNWQYVNDVLRWMN